MRRAAVLFLLLAWAGPGAAAEEAAPAAPAALTGRVVVAGEPGEGVEVRMWRLPLSPGPVPLGADDSDGMHPDRGLEPPIPPRPADAVARTDAEGRFAIADAGAGRFLLLATASGGARGFERVVHRPGERDRGVEIPIVGGPLSLRGRARWRDGRPFEGVLVLMSDYASWPGSRGRFEGAVATAPDGTFEIPGLEAGLVGITAVQPGRLRAYLGSILLPYDVPLDLAVDEELGITKGSLVDPRGRPVAGAELFLRREAPGYADWCESVVLARARTGADGTFRVLGPLVPEFRIVGSDRWMPSPEPRGPADADLVLVARPRPRISGVVRRENGEPVGGVPVLACDEEYRFPPEVAVSDLDGRYSIGLPVERVLFGPVGRGYVPADRSHDALMLRMAPGEEVERDLVVEPAARISGRVLDEKGRPVAGARVAPGGNPFLETEVAPDLLRQLPGAVTDAEGRYELTAVPVEAGWPVTAWANGYVGADGRTSGAAEEVIDFRLDRTVEDARRSFDAPEPKPEPDRFLRVLGPDGSPVPRGNWQFVGSFGDDGFLDGRIAFGLKRGRESPRIRIFGARDARGRPLPYGPVLVGPLEPGEHTVTLAPGRVVEGRVVTPGGRPVRGVWIASRHISEDGRPGDSSRTMDRSDLDGRFRLAGLDEGVNELSADVPSTYVEPAQVTLAGVVLDGAGRPVPDATVFVRSAAGAAPLPDGFSYERIDGGFVLAAITGDDGRFAIEGLPATTLELFAAGVHGDDAERAEVRTPVATAPTEGPEVELRLP